jgi:cellulose synthase/poly-beta-1,6-N-acetylglucosamine synthase-like glycosyltransferase
MHWGGWYEATKLLGGSLVFQEATSGPAGKAQKPTAWYLMPHNKHPDRQGCNYQFCNHKIFSPRKHRLVNIHPSVFVHAQCIIFLSLFIASSSALICSCYSSPSQLFCICILLLLLEYLQFCFCFVWLFSVRLFSVIFCSDTRVVFKAFWSTYYHINNNLASQ